MSEQINRILFLEQKQEDGSWLPMRPFFGPRMVQNADQVMDQLARAGFATKYRIAPFIRALT